MKKKNILLSVCIAIALGSCSDYLDVEKDLKDRMTLDEVFTSRDYTEQWLAGAYRYVSNYNADMGYGGEWPFAFADDIYHPTYKSFAEKSYGESTYQTSYGYCYQGIRQASVFIQNVDKCEAISVEERADMKAQARFIRAFYYWKLLQKYGPIPLIPEDAGQDYTKPYEELYLPRNTYDECVEYISNEMVEAARYLPVKRETFNIARPTKGAALGYRARALLYAASPLMNGNDDNYAASLVDDKGNRLLNPVYDEEKWAKAAAAARDIMELTKDDGLPRYELYYASVRETDADADGAYPATIKPFDDGNFSTKNWPDGYADIDPFESYRSIFNGELTAAENPELIFSRVTNQGSGTKQMVQEQLPKFTNGKNRLGMTQKQCDAYYMWNGEDCPGKDREIGRGDGSSRKTGFVTAEDVKAGRYKPLREGVSLQYADREPRFYASVAFNGAYWPLAGASLEKNRRYQCWYYQGTGEDYTGSEGIVTGIGMMKFVNPMDNDAKEDAEQEVISIREKSDPAIRYGEILLDYAEAINELQGTHQIASWDGSKTYTLQRTTEELKKGIQPVRIRAGIPDFDNSVYESQVEFRKKLKRERQIELMGEGHRYFDLRRWKDAAEEESLPMYGCNTKMTKEQPETFHQPVRISEVQTRFIERSYFWPFHIDELYRNRRLTQNPGWKSSK